MRRDQAEKAVTGVGDDARTILDTALFAAFAGLALTLACVGLYGVLSHMVTQRTSEVGVRMALGATSREVLLSFAGRGLALTLMGLAIGLVLAMIAARLMGSLFYGFQPNFGPVAAAVAALRPPCPPPCGPWW